MRRSGGLYNNKCMCIQTRPRPVVPARSKRVGRSGSIYRKEEIKETSVRFTILETDDLQKPSLSTRRHVESLPDPGRRSAK